MIDNPVYRGGDDGEVRQASPMPMEVVTGPGEQRSDPDYDDVSNGKGKSTTSSKNPVYGQPTTQRAAGTPQNQVFNIIDMLQTYHASRARES